MLAGTNAMSESDNTAALPPYAKEWMAQWRYAAEELPKIRAKELRELTDEVSISLFDQHGPATELPCENGLVIQQAWFSRFRILQLQRDVCGVAEC